MITDNWTNKEVRALLAALHNGKFDTDLWYPDKKRVASARHVSYRTVPAWYAGAPEAPASISPDRLRKILKGHRPTLQTRRREEADKLRLEKMLLRARLGRGRGNMREYSERGWNEPHMLVITRTTTSPLARPTILRADTQLLEKRVGTRLIIAHSIHESRFHAELARYEMLEANEHLRLRIGGHKQQPSWTQEFLTTSAGWHLQLNQPIGA